MPPRPAFEHEAETVGVAVADLETIDGEVIGVDDPAWHQRHQFKRNRRPSFAPEARQHPGHDFESAGTAVHRHGFGALLRSQGGKQSGNAEHVVEMAVGQ